MPKFDPKHPRHRVLDPGPKLDPANLPTGLIVNRGKPGRIIQTLLDQGVLITADQLPRPLRKPTNLATILYPILLTAFPNWCYGLQALGDCMAWSTALSCDTAAAVEIHLRDKYQTIIGRTMIEALYGFMRVEALGLDENPSGDGAMPNDAVNAVTNWGTLHYKSYLRNQYHFPAYDSTGDRGRNFGRYGVPDPLEPIAKPHTATRCILVRNFTEACACIDLGFPITNAHPQNPIPRARDADGFGIDLFQAAHAMNYIGYRNGTRPGLLQINSGHGYHVDGPRVPADMPDCIANCSAWLDAQTVDAVLAANWTYAVEGYNGKTKAILLDFPLDLKQVHPHL